MFKNRWLPVFAIYLFIHLTALAQNAVDQPLHHRNSGTMSHLL